MLFFNIFRNCFGIIVRKFRTKRFDGMKRILKIAVFVAMVTTILWSCAKEGPGRFKGNYSFKTSGTVSCREKGDEAAEIFKIHLTDEQGQMDILESEDNGMLVTMNIISGSVVVFDAKAEGKVISLAPKDRVLSIRTGISSATTNLDAVVRGEGQRFDNSVIFDLTYTGSYVYLGTEYEIVESDVQCVAKKN